MKSLRLLGLSLAGILATVSICQADSSSASAPAAAAATPSSTSSIFQTVKKNTSGFYQLALSGPNMKSLSGNTSGDGTNIRMVHYVGLGYKLSDKWRFGITQPFTQIIDEVPAAQADPFYSNDPYVSFSNVSLWGSKKYGTNLYGQIRYYAPVSRSSSKAVASLSQNEAGRGTFRLYFAPSKSWMDGALNLNMQVLLYYRMSSYSAHDRAALKGGNPDRNDMLFIFNPVLGYSFTDKVEGYLEYGSQQNHNTSGHWGRYKDDDYVSVGANWQVAKRLLLNPYLDAPPATKEFDNAGVGLQAIYTFL